MQVPRISRHISAIFHHFSGFNDASQAYLHSHSPPYHHVRRRNENIRLETHHGFYETFWPQISVKFVADGLYSVRIVSILGDYVEIKVTAAQHHCRSKRYYKNDGYNSIEETVIIFGLLLGKLDINLTAT